MGRHLANGFWSIFLLPDFHTQLPPSNNGSGNDPGKIRIVHWRVHTKTTLDGAFVPTLDSSLPGEWRVVYGLFCPPLPEWFGRFLDPTPVKFGGNSSVEGTLLLGCFGVFLLLTHIDLASKVIVIVFHSNGPMIVAKTCKNRFRFFP